MEVKDKIIVVTGAASGIGREAALLFASEGASVVVADREPEAGAACVAAIERPPRLR